MSFEMCYSGNSVPEEKKILERKRNLLYLILFYLRDSGFRLTAETLTQEGQLSDSFQVCDNIDLETILQEYESYYFLKYQKHPKIIKKCLMIKSDSITSFDSRTKKGKCTSDNKKNGETISILSKDSNDRKCQLTCASLKVTALCNASAETGTSSLVGTPQDLGTLSSMERSKIIKPLCEFPGFCSEWREMAEIISKEIITQNLNVKWDDVLGHQHAKSILIESTVYPMKYPHLFKGILSPWKGILLHGPPGSGKTLLAKAVATECKSVFFNVSTSILISKWRGDSEKLVRVLFDLARHNSPSVIFLDEIEAISSHRDSPSEHEASRRFKSELLRQLDGIQENRDNNLLLLATTNLPWELDSAMLRRLEKRIHVDLPDEKARSMMITKLLPKSIRWPISEVKDILDKTIGYSGADIYLICKEAAMNILRQAVKTAETENMKGHKFKEPSVDLSLITAQQILDVIERTKPTAHHLVEKHASWASSFGSM